MTPGMSLWSCPGWAEASNGNNQDAAIAATSVRGEGKGFIAGQKEHVPGQRAIRNCGHFPVAVSVAGLALAARFSPRL